MPFNITSPYTLYPTNFFNRNYRFEFFTIEGSYGSFIIKENQFFDLSNTVNFSFSYSIALQINNSITLKFYNLTKQYIDLFTGENTRQGFTFSAWYGAADERQLNADSSQGSTVIFRGLTYKTNTYREGPDIITEVYGADIFVNLQGKSIKKTYPPGTTYYQIISDVLTTYNNVTTLNPVSEQYLQDSYETYKTFIGQPDTIVSKIAADAGLLFSKDRTVISLFPRTLNLGNPAEEPIYINNTKGLVGYVRATGLSTQIFPVTYLQNASLNNNISLIQVTTLLRHYRITDLIYLESEQFTGYYRVLSVDYEGEWRGNPWYAHLTLWPERLSKNSTGNIVPSTFNPGG